MGTIATQTNQTKEKNTHKHSLPPGLCGDNLFIS